MTLAERVVGAHDAAVWRLGDAAVRVRRRACGNGVARGFWSRPPRCAALRAGIAEFKRLIEGTAYEIESSVGRTPPPRAVWLGVRLPCV